MPTADETRQLRAITVGLDKFTERAVIGVSLDVAANLKESNPVDTGWSRANWVPSVSQPIDEPVGSPGDATTAAQAQAAGEASILRYRLSQGRVFITNVVAYIVILNDRGARNARNSRGEIVGPGWVQIAISKAVTSARRLLP